MTATELKKVLISRITSIEDVAFLEAIKTILDTKSVYGTIMLNEQIKEDIKVSREEFNAGQYVTHDELDKEMKKWLNEK